tara:strand:+ start:648 stop:1832 length:1185 start_codon:yes stop_codon:yes gene_type:complete
VRKIDKDEGWFEVEDNPISKAGVFEYLGSNISPDLQPDKIYSVYRPAEELNNDETKESFKLLPWIITHKMLGDAFDPEDSANIEGFIGEKIYFKDNTLYANIKAVSKRLRDFIGRGVKELSCGYQCDWVISPGTTPDGESYDVIQRNIRGNHLALVDSGRMGPDVAVMDNSINYTTFAFDSQKGKNMDDLKDRVAGDDDLETRVGVMEDMLKTNNDALGKITDMLSKLTKDYDKDVKVVEDEDDKDKIEMSEDECGEDSDDMAKDDDNVEVVEDEDDKDKAKDSYSMDSLSKQLRILQNKVNRQELAAKQQKDKISLHDQASYHIGAFDHADMTLGQMSKYISQKLGLNCRGDQYAAVQGYLAATKMPHLNTQRSHATDSSDTNLMDTILGSNK